jgi:hypothetical protein
MRMMRSQGKDMLRHGAEGVVVGSVQGLGFASKMIRNL